MGFQRMWNNGNSAQYDGGRVTPKIMAYQWKTKQQKTTIKRK